jgi:cell division protein FtsQ
MKGGNAQRRRKSSRLRPFWMLLTLGIVVIAGLVAAATFWPGFAPSQIDVNGNRTVSRSDIIAHAGIATNVTLWLQNTDAAAKRIETIPYVDEAWVKRIPPSTIEITVTERTPLATLALAGDRTDTPVLIDKQLRVLGPVTDPGTLPRFTLAQGLTLDPGTVLTRADAVALRDDYLALLAAHVIPVGLSFDRFGGVVATLRGGINVLLGDDADLAKKLPLIDPILAQAARKDRTVSAIDLRAPNTPVLIFK